MLADLERVTGKPCREIFDFVAGTSTGALIAAAVAAGVPASEMLKVYTVKSARIFKAFLPSLGALVDGNKFDTNAIADVLSETLGVSKSWTLNDCPIRVLLTARGVNKKAWYFTRDTPQNGGKTGRLSLVECATASAAAPIYFNFFYVHPLAGEVVGHCADGGVGTTGNPVYQACVEAFFHDDFQPEETRVLSLGTGFCPSKTVNPPRGILNTLLWTLDTLIDAPHDEQTGAVNRHWPGILQRYDWELLHPIDMADLNAIPELVLYGDKAARAINWDAVLRALDGEPTAKGETI